METKKLLMNWRGTPIGARTPDGSPSIGLTRRVGRALRCGLTAVLMLFAAQGAWAGDYTGYVYTANQELSSFKNAHPDEPWIWLSKVTYDMEKDLNVYEFKLKYHVMNNSQFWNNSVSNNQTTGPVLFGWYGNVWLTIDGAEVFDLSTLHWNFPSEIADYKIFNAAGIGGTNNPLMDINPHNYLYNFWSFFGSYGSIEVDSKGSSTGLANVSSVYVSACEPKIEVIDYWKAIQKWYSNLIPSSVQGTDYVLWYAPYVIQYVTIRVGLERTWTQKSPQIGVKGQWRALSKYGLYTRDYNINSDNFKFTPPTVSWPSSSGKLERTGNGKVKYTTPSASSKTGKQLKDKSRTIFSEHSVPFYIVDETENCTFLNNVYLMTNAGNDSQPWTSISKSNKYYAKLTNVTSSAQTHEITGVSNYEPFYVYPCWELESQENYKSMATLSSTYRQHHNKFMDALVVPGYPCPTNVDVTTVDAFSRKVNVKWNWAVKDANHCDTNGKWYVFRRLGTDGQTLKIGEVSNGTASEYSVNYTPSSDNLPDYGVEYNYIVCFVPNGWTVNNESDATGLWASKSDSITRSFKKVSSITAKASDDKITVSWEHLPLTDASNSNKYVMYVERSEDSGDNKTWVTKETREISDNAQTTGTWDDTDITAKKTYYYRVRFPSVQGGAAESDVVSATSGGSTFVAGSFKASRGNYSNTVKLTWQVKQVGTGECYFTLQRRPLGSVGSEGWADIYTTHGTASTYSYDDQTAQPGSFNEYKVIISEKVGSEMVMGDTETCDGFCMATGTMSGRVAFGSGTAVDSVKVTMRPSTSDGNTVNRFRSLYFVGLVNTTEGGSGMTCTTTTEELVKIFDNDFTIQMWINPSSEMTDGVRLFDIPKAVALDIQKTDATKGELAVGLNNNGVTMSKKLYVDYDKWTNVVLTYEKATSKVTLYTLDGKTVDKATSNYTLGAGKISGAGGLFGLGNWANRCSPTAYQGYMDEFRAFNRALTQSEIERNYNHPLVGTEEGLQVYYSFDEGIQDQKLAYDFSKQNGISNGHHGITNIPTTSSTIIPSEDQFSLMGYTDKDGNYMIGGITISGDGTNYVAKPTLGIHKFSPATQSRYFSMNSLVQTGVDFEDVSSFPVSGVVYYEGTTIPVKEVYVKVDGISASKDGKPVQTNEQGEFTVDVPIGDHFVSLEKNGHTFVKDGRYPEDLHGTGERENFNDSVKGLRFYDNTTVTVVGRVAGGDSEAGKPLGVGAGKANIGKAKLTLSFPGSDGSKYINAVVNNNGYFDLSSEQLDYSTKLGKAYVVGGKNVITIETDPETGEFEAQLPPLNYTVESAQIPANTDIVFDNNKLPTFDATNPLLYYTDSLVTENGEVKKCEYVASLKLKYREPVTFSVKEREDGSFGLKTYITAPDVNNVKHSVNLYDVDATDGTVTYTYDYPIYQEFTDISYNIRAFEQYVNKDGGTTPDTWTYTEEPLRGCEVTIQNPFAVSQSVTITMPYDATQVEGTQGIEDNKFKLDSLGTATYNFMVGNPNMSSPYTRGLTITYKIDDTSTSWEGNNKFKAIILGSQTTGNNFVTNAPDVVTMVLRDPPGSNSSATWSKGTSISVDKGRVVEVHGALKGKAVVHAGGSVVTGTGLGFIVNNEFKNKIDLGVGAEASFSFSNDIGNTTTTTTLQDISTSDSPDYDGADGDLFIGHARNIIFGACHLVYLKWDDAEGKAVLTYEDALSTGDEFPTAFVYTQKHVEEALIPNFRDLRNKLIQTVANVDNVLPPANGEDPKYVTTLDKDDPRFGSDNNDKSIWGNSAVSIETMKNGVFKGPSYTMIVSPDDAFNKNYQDMVKHYNEQIKKWQNELAKNEEAKAKAIASREAYLKRNHSFDAGGTITQTDVLDSIYHRVNTETEEVNVIFSQDFGLQINAAGVSFSIEETAGLAFNEYQERDTVKTVSTSYTLADGDVDDYLSVDVLADPVNAKFGPIFYTRAGVTRCPYEGEVKTQYYEPGTVIMEATVQAERPEIEARTQAVTGIPAGGKGTFQVYLRNNSDTKEDMWYDLSVIDTTNPNGLVITMDGVNINRGRSILVPAGETMTKTFTVEQSDLDVLTYEDVKIRISSQCQGDDTRTHPEIADTTSVSFFFQPSCSDVQLTSSHSLVNSDTETTQTLSISGYNYSMASLKGIRLQYKGEHDADFKTLQEYTKDADAVASDVNLKLLPALEGTNKLNYTIDLRDNEKFTDKTYVFRAVTVCMQSGEEVNNESDEVKIVRDLTRPQLMATPSPASGILSSGDDLLITFNEDIQSSLLSKTSNFEVMGVLNESEVMHDVALSLTGENTAKTEGTVDLADKSFSASMWLNYSHDGTLLQHGTKDQSFTLAVEDGKLAVSVAGTKVTSSVSLPANKWVYLNVAYDADMNQVSAGYASDASEVMLLSQETVPAYEGNGPVSVGGNNFVGKVQELALWNGFHSMAEAQAEMYTTKSQFTNGLMGYWPLDEGHGDVATDKARSRNLTLPSVNAWWINGDNYALPLDGTKAAAVNIGALNTTASEDYLVEAWFKADESNNAVASVLSTLAMDLRLNAQGKLELALGEVSAVNGITTTTAVYDKDLRDGQWHHVALNVLKSTNGSGIVYVDGQQRKQLSASVMPALYGDKLLLGAHRTGMLYDQMLKGAVDEVRIWKGRRTADVIKNNMYARVKGDETGLVAYYPLETSVRDQYNQIVSTATFNDKTAESTEALAFYTANGTSLDAQTSILNSQNTAALKQAPQMDQVSFSFVTSERQIMVNLEELPAKMEGCHIYITAKNVKDVNGNSALPITWSVYVQQNNLKWQENDLAVTKEGAEEATFTATIENRGSQSEAWSLSDLPTWLSASTEAGTLMPLASQKLTFTVADGLPIGTYETTIYVTGSQNIATPLNVTVTSEGDAPDWTATPGEFTMTIMGVLTIDGVQSSDPKDMVAAFRGTECVGVARPQYFSRFDSYMLMLTVYGNENAPLTYKAYDASTGTVYPSVSVSDENANTFVQDKMVGSLNNPANFTPLNEIEQDLSHNRASWKWFSLYAQPKDSKASVVFKDAKNAINAISDGTTAVVAWDGNIFLAPGNMYKLNATAPYTEYLVGEPADPTAIDITLKGNGWTWIGYPCQAMNSLDAAFTSVAHEGDIVKNQSSFAIYTQSGWVGSLTAMVPGEGYMYSNSGAAKNFHFPKPAVSGKKNAPALSRVSNVSNQSMASGFRDNMTMIAVVMNGDELVEDAQVSVYANGELCGFSGNAIRVKPCESVAHFITIGGENNDVLTFVVSTEDGDYVVATNEVFKADAQRGTMAQPVVLQLGEATSIDMAMGGMSIKSVQLFDSNGRLMRSAENPSRMYTKDDLKQMPAGVYYQQVTYTNGQMRVQKLMR